MGKFHGIRKRKVPQDKEKVVNAKKNAKHLIEFGESHPLDDKKDKLEDRLAKRVYDEENATKGENDNVDDDDNESSDSQGEETNFYGQLLEVFGKKTEETADSDNDSANEEGNLVSEKKTNAIGNAFDEFDTEEGHLEADNEEVESADEEDDESNSTKTDNFNTHFFTNFDSKDIESLSKAENVTTALKWPHMGSFVECRPQDEKFNLIKIEKPFRSVDQMNMKPILRENISKTMLEITQNQKSCLTPFQIELLGVLSSYKDLYFPERNESNSEQLRVAYCLHALNHVLKTRSRVILHNAKISANPGTQKDEYRDQGLTRPKVLLVLPFRESAFRVINCMINLLFADAKDTGKRKVNIMNYKRFQKEFGPPEDEAPMSVRKPDDYKQLFAGNIDDSFRIGLSLTKKSLKLYNKFYMSDIIIASPLGLRTIIGAEGDDEREYDFLSSIEIAIFDQADIFLMQNWEHVLHLMAHTHLRPKNDHGVDYSRVRLWVLEMWSRYYRQLLVFSSTTSSMISGFFNKFSANYSGKLIVRNEITTNRAAINHVYIQCQQIYQRFECENFAANSDTRFAFFVRKILPKFKDKMMVRTMIYVPSYFDFVRIRNYLRKEDIGFTQICEYTNEGKVAKARHIFFYGGRQFLLFTERFHFFYRYTIKGIRHLIFYEPPTYPHFYSELVNSMHLSNQGKKLTTDYSSMSVTVLFNKYDAHSLIGLVGTKTATSLVQSDSDEHMFVTENALT